MRIKFLITAVTFFIFFGRADTEAFLQQTPLLNYESPVIEKLYAGLGITGMSPRSKIIAIYFYLRDNIRFGFTKKPFSKASEILLNYRGDSVAKSILAMALFRKAGIPSRIRFFTVDKRVVKKILPYPLYLLLNKEILHAVVEVKLQGMWKSLETLVYDRRYLKGLRKIANRCGTFWGYGTAIEELCKINFNWAPNEKLIAENFKIRDFGIYSSPDDFLKEQKWKGSTVKSHVFNEIIIKILDNEIAKLRRFSL